MAFLCQLTTGRLLALAELTPPSTSSASDVTSLERSLDAAADRQWEKLIERRERLDAPATAGSEVSGQKRVEDAVMARVQQQTEVADEARDFYTANASDSRAASARAIEIISLVGVVEEGDKTLSNRLEAAVNSLRQGAYDVNAKSRGVAAYEFTRALRGVGDSGQRKELALKVARSLVKEYPTTAEGYSVMLAVAKASAAKQATILAREVVESPAPQPLKLAAERLIRRHELPGRVLTELLGGEGQKALAALPAGQPVVIYSWSQFAPGSRALGQMIQARRFAAIGVCLDEDQAAAAKVALLDGMGGEMIYDAQGASGSVATRLYFDAPGQIYLVDKAGLLQDAQGGDDLEAKLKAYEFKTPPITPPQPFNPSR